MRKKIDEMREVCELKADNDALAFEISGTELRVAQLRKLLGKGEVVQKEKK